MLINNESTPTVEQVNPSAHAAGVSQTPRPPSECLSWYDEMIEDHYLSVRVRGFCHPSIRRH